MGKARLGMAISTHNSGYVELKVMRRCCQSPDFTLLKTGQAMLMQINQRSIGKRQGALYFSSGWLAYLRASITAPDLEFTLGSLDFVVCQVTA